MTGVLRRDEYTRTGPAERPSEERKWPSICQRESRLTKGHFCQHLDLGLLHSKTVRNYIAVVKARTPRLWTSTSPRPIRNREAQQEMSTRQGSETTLPLLPEPCLLSSPPTTISGKIVFHETGPWHRKGWGPLVEATQAVALCYGSPSERIQKPSYKVAQKLCDVQQQTSERVAVKQIWSHRMTVHSH